MIDKTGEVGQIVEKFAETLWNPIPPFVKWRQLKNLAPPTVLKIQYQACKVRKEQKELGRLRCGCWRLGLEPKWRWGASGQLAEVNSFASSLLLPTSSSQCLCSMASSCTWGWQQLAAFRWAHYMYHAIPLFLLFPAAISCLYLPSPILSSFLDSSGHRTLLPCSEWGGCQGSLLASPSC